MFDFSVSKHPHFDNACRQFPTRHNLTQLAKQLDNVFAITTIYATQKAAMRAAQSKWEKLQRGVAEFSITLAMGRADLFPETPVAVNGFKSVIDQQSWVISKVAHSLSNSGYTTQLSLEVLLSDVTYEAE